MSFTHTVTQSVLRPSGSIVKAKDYTASLLTELDESVANGETVFVINVAIDVSAVKSFYLVSDKAVTLKTNSSSAPDNTLTLVAGVPYLWNTDSYDTFKLTVDVTKFYVANASGAAANILLSVLHDATP